MKDIIRFKERGKKILLHYKVTEEQAKEWCESEKTKKPGKWFDGFAESDTQCVKQNPYYSRYFNPNEL